MAGCGRDGVKQEDVLRLGIDIGSTTVKTVLIDNENKTVFCEYKRHAADIAGTLHSVLEKAISEIGDVDKAEE